MVAGQQRGIVRCTGTLLESGLCSLALNIGDQNRSRPGSKLLIVLLWIDKHSYTWGHRGIMCYSESQTYFPSYTPQGHVYTNTYQGNARVSIPGIAMFSHMPWSYFCLTWILVSKLSTHHLCLLGAPAASIAHTAPERSTAAHLHSAFILVFSIRQPNSIHLTYFIQLCVCTMFKCIKLGNAALVS